MSKFSENFKKLRSSIPELTQDVLAKELNVSRSRISMYERGEREPDIKTLHAIADYFNVSVDWLIGNTINQYLKNRIEELELSQQDLTRMGISYRHLIGLDNAYPPDELDYLFVKKTAKILGLSEKKATMLLARQEIPLDQYPESSISAEEDFNDIDEEQTILGNKFLKAAARKNLNSGSENQKLLENLLRGALDLLSEDSKVGSDDKAKD